MPTALRRAKTDRRHAEQAVAAVSQAKTILLIDGHEQDRQYYAHRLKVSSPDYTILEATSAVAGLELFHSQAIDCVVLELGLSDASGFEVLTRLVPFSRHPDIPVVVLTASTSRALLEVAKMNGAFATLQKLTTCGDDLAKVVHKAMAVIPVDKSSHFDRV